MDKLEIVMHVSDMLHINITKAIVDFTFRLKQYHFVLYHSTTTLPPTVLSDAIVDWLYERESKTETDLCDFIRSKHKNTLVMTRNQYLEEVN